MGDCEKAVFMKSCMAFEVVRVIIIVTVVLFLASWSTPKLIPESAATATLRMLKLKVTGVWLSA